MTLRRIRHSHPKRKIAFTTIWESLHLFKRKNFREISTYQKGVRTAAANSSLSTGFKPTKLPHQWLFQPNLQIPRLVEVTWKVSCRKRIFGQRFLEVRSQRRNWLLLQPKLRLALDHHRLPCPQICIHRRSSLETIDPSFGGSDCLQSRYISRHSRPISSCSDDKLVWFPALHQKSLIARNANASEIFFWVNSPRKLPEW